jgi:hypothetical protein
MTDTPPRVWTDNDRRSFRELAAEGVTNVVTDADILRFYAWCDELNAEAVRQGRNPEMWPMHESVIRGGNCWLPDFEKGLTPADALRNAD